MDYAPLSEAARMARFMGLPDWETMDDLSLAKRVGSGLPVSTVQKVADQVDPASMYLKPHSLIPKATYYRRKEQNKPLSRGQSERIFSISKVFSETLRQYHGDRQSAALFLSRKHPLLGGYSPLEMALESVAGADLVLQLLEKAEAGVAV